MELIPILEIKAGHSLVQTQAKASQPHLFTTEPLRIAKRWQEEGAARLHLVDIDGARVGMPQNREIIRDLIRRVTLPIDLSGGIPNLDVANRMFGLGVDRIVVQHGTIPDKDIMDLLREHTRQIVVEIIAIDGQWAPPGLNIPPPPPPPISSPGSMSILGSKPYDPLAPHTSRPSSRITQGTTPPPVNVSAAPANTDGRTPISHYVAYMKTMGARTVIVHSVTQNGTSGALHQDLAALGRGASIPVILRGEVVRRRAIEVLQASGVQGMILGKALYDGTLSLPDLLTIG